MGAVDLPTLVEVALEAASSRLQSRAALRRDYGPAPFVEADEPGLLAAVKALIGEVADAVPDGGRAARVVRVAIAATPGGAAVEVHLPGIEPAPGSWCDLARAAGATVDAARLRLELPTANPTWTPPDPRGRVLLVDDDHDVLRSTQRGLVFQHDVSALDDARHALRALAEGERFDVILCDLVMPEFGGIELHAHLTALAPDVLPTIVFVTGGAFTPATQEFLERVTSLEKPVTLATIRRLIASAIRGSRIA